MWLRGKDDAQGLPEYALLAAMVIVMVVTVVYFLYPDVVIATFTKTGQYILDSPQARGVR